MTKLYLYDDAVARTFEPFSLTRPVGELRAGAELIRRRWERQLQLEGAGFIGAPYLAEFEEEGAPGAVADDTELAAGSVIANTRCVPSLAEPHGAVGGARAWMCDGRLAAVRIEQSLPAAALRDGRMSLDDLAQRNHVGEAASGRQDVPITPSSGAGIAPMTGRWMEALWDAVASLPDQLAEDIPALAAGLTIHNPADALVVGDHPVYCERGAMLEPWVMLDATAGSILIRNGSTVSAFTRLSGPCYIGEHAMILGDRITSSSIGDHSKIRGEVNHSIVLAYSNKAHSGFLGHSYLGRWVNLGAGTTTSNMKNTYGQVQLRTRDGSLETGQQFLGTFFGDHVKTGIGTMLTTGTILGAGANVFGTEQPPKLVPPFAWGEREPYGRYDLDRFLGVAERMMARRNVELTERSRRCLRSAYERAMAD